MRINFFIGQAPQYYVLVQYCTCKFTSTEVTFVNYRIMGFGTLYAFKLRILYSYYQQRAWHLARVIIHYGVSLSSRDSTSTVKKYSIVVSILLFPMLIKRSVSPIHCGFLPIRIFIIFELFE